ncbi:MAG: class I SAM-dependent rRNA methyltransferase [Rhodothermales bacterium]|nr:class I SAM-dependent rRNA methyltransferase [Rhodothermales bacterium]
MPDRPVVTLRPGKDKGLRRGYPWAFGNQLERLKERPPAGTVVRLDAHGGDPLGLGFYHDTSLIAVRFLTADLDAEIGDAFFRRRVERAVELRKAAFPEATHARVVFGESDGLPGTVVDRYGPAGWSGGVLTYTCLSYGMEQHREGLLDALEELLQPDAIVERNDAPLREKDRLEQGTGVLRGDYGGPVTIEEGGVRFEVDVLNGPKTGFFIDQRLHRLALRPFARGRRVLDVFCADGGFGLHAAAAGAESVHFLDASGDALDRVRRNAELNGLVGAIETEQADALDRLGAMAEEGREFDLVVLDPPGFAQSRRHVEAASKAYQRINISGLQLLPPGGFLATASCSQAVGEDDFLKIVRYSARRAGVQLRLLYRGTQPPDHPVLEAMPETHYLKFYLFQRLHDEVLAG